jgi:4'-phosphopantetheinyl transferase
VTALTKLCPVILANARHDSDAKGLARVAEQRRRALEALRCSERETGAELSDALEKDPNDAPLPSNGWHWSISHTRAFSAGIVSRAPVGIDIESVVQRRLEVVTTVASRAERELFRDFGPREFIRVWTAKEAVLKKAGVGLAELSAARVLSVPNDNCLVLSHRGREHLAHQWEYRGHVAAISTDESGDLEVHWTWEAHDGEHDG